MGTVTEAAISTSEGRVVPGCRAWKSNRRVVTSAPRGQVVPWVVRGNRTGG